MSRLYEALARDNSARIAAESAAKASEADLSKTLNAIGDAVIATDAEGRIHRVNPALGTLLHLETADVEGKRLTELVQVRNPETKADTVDPVSLALTGQEALETNGQFLLVLKDGNERKVSASYTRMSGGDSAGVVVVLHDTTERQHLEDQIRRTQKLESLGQLAGGVAHDFNNLLQVIKANLAFIQETCQLNEEEREYFKQIDEAAGRATDLTRQLLALGRRQTMQFKELSPEDLVRNFLKLIRRVIGESIEVNFKSASLVDSIMGDAGQVEQVLLNLCVNARDAMPKGGRLSIELRNVQISAEECAAWPWARPGRYVKLSIADSGHGMSKETLSHIFEPFFTTKAVGKGSGLGLSVVQGIVQQHGGFLNAYSEVDLGTTFSLFIPSQRPSGLVGEAKGGEAEKVLGSGANQLVLLVEDEAPVRFVASAILRRNGYRVLPAGDGEEALRLASGQLADISVAVLDVVMPRMGGIDAARRLQELKPELPILLCTGYAGGITLPELGDHGSWRLLNKPYSNQELLVQVKQAIEDGRKARL
jgi:PAS domain S-box-containing protein